MLLRCKEACPGTRAPAHNTHFRFVVESDLANPPTSSMARTQHRTPYTVWNGVPEGGTARTHSGLWEPALSAAVLEIEQAVCILSLLLTWRGTEKIQSYMPA